MAKKINKNHVSLEWSEPSLSIHSNALFSQMRELRASEVNVVKFTELLKSRMGARDVSRLDPLRAGAVARDKG